MYTLYVAIAIAFAAIPLIIRRNRRRSEKPWLDSLGYFFLTLFGTCCCALIVAFVINVNLPDKTTVTGPYKLVAMRSADGLSSSFVWGTYGVSGVAVFRIYVENDDGSMSPYQMLADNSTRIMEDGSLHGQGSWLLTTVSKDYSSPLAKWAIGPDDRRPFNRLTVPVGTVVHDFKAN